MAQLERVPVEGEGSNPNEVAYYFPVDNYTSRETTVWELDATLGLDPEDRQTSAEIADMMLFSEEEADPRYAAERARARQASKVAASAMGIEN